MRKPSLTSSRRYIAAAAVLIAATGLQTAHAGVLFTDGFESGNKLLSSSGIAWSDSASTVVSSDRAFTGSNSLKFIFKAGGSGEDAWAEQRIRLPQKTDYWFKYKLYIPTNYVHRNDGASNNKFLAVYRAPYTSPGFQVNFSLQPNGSGGSNLEIHHYNGGKEGGVRSAASNFIADGDKGKWMDLIIEVKVPTSSTSSDGVMKLWKNGNAIVNVTNLPSWGGSGANYIDEAYLLGWANSGFGQETLLYIDDISVADTPIAGGPAPMPPTSVSVQ